MNFSNSADAADGLVCGGRAGPSVVGNDAARACRFWSLTKAGLPVGRAVTGLLALSRGVTSGEYARERPGDDLDSDGINARDVALKAAAAADCPESGVLDKLLGSPDETDGFGFGMGTRSVGNTTWKGFRLAQRGFLSDARQPD